MRQFKIYLDMDGVITDFDSAVRALGSDTSKGLADNASQEEKQVMYDAIEKAGESFWAQMPWTSDGRKLWAWLRQFKPVLLSSPSKFNWAPSGKIQWIKNNLPEAQLYMENDKWRYAEPNAILIDDMEDNIGAWESRGGIGILHTDANSTINKVLQTIKNISPSKAEMIIIHKTLKDMKDKLSIRHSVADKIRKIAKDSIAYKGDPAKERLIKHVIPKITKRPYNYEDATLILKELKPNLTKRGSEIHQFYEEALRLCEQKSSRTYEAINKLIAAMEDTAPKSKVPQPVPNPYRPVLHLQPAFASYLKKAFNPETESIIKELSKHPALKKFLDKMVTESKNRGITNPVELEKDVKKQFYRHVLGPFAPQHLSRIPTWNEIRDAYTKKYGKNHHCLKLHCTKCGSSMTCRCSTTKTDEWGCK